MSYPYNYYVKVVETVRDSDSVHFKCSVFTGIVFFILIRRMDLGSEGQIAYFPENVFFYFFRILNRIFSNITN